MEVKIQAGIKGEQKLIVSEKDTASQYGSGLIDVFATPAMIGLMESTAQQSVMAFLPDNHITLGTEVNIKHLKATPVGKEVSCFSELISVEGRQLVFKLSAYDDKGEIGNGFHTRVIVDKTKFLQKLLTQR